MPLKSIEGGLLDQDLFRRIGLEPARSWGLVCSTRAVHFGASIDPPFLVLLESSGEHNGTNSVFSWSDTTPAWKLSPSLQP